MARAWGEIPGKALKVTASRNGVDEVLDLITQAGEKQGLTEASPAPSGS